MKIYTKKFKLRNEYLLEAVYNFVSDNDFDVDRIGGNDIRSSGYRLSSKDDGTHIWFVFTHRSPLGDYYRCVFNTQFEI